MPQPFRHLAGGFALMTLAALPLAAQTAPEGVAAKPPATPVSAAPISAEIGEKGITAVLARLNTEGAKDPEARFARAGLEFLAAVERAYQWRTRYGIREMGALMLGSAADLPESPSVVPMPPESFAEEVELTLAAMDRLRADIEGVAEGPEFGLALDLGDLWFDLDANGQRSPEENATSLLEGVAYFSTPAESGQPSPAPTIRFDNADAGWLTAYSHIVSGAGELVLAFDPTPSIRRVMETQQRIIELRFNLPPDQDPSELFFLDGYVDPLAIVLDMLGHQPQPERTRKAKAHWRETVVLNNILWQLIAAETDNAGEWIPNDRQISATGLDFPQGTGPAWLAVLADGDALLTGKRTVPFWRAPIGVDIAAWLENPAPLPLDGIIQGWALAPYFSTEPTVSAESYERFADMLMETGPFLAMVMLN